VNFFGFDTSDPAGLQAAIKAAEPVIAVIENRLGGIGESWLDRIDGATITIPEITITLKLKPIPKAQAVG
jgi:hypothetical protein